MHYKHYEDYIWIEYQLKHNPREKKKGGEKRRESKYIKNQFFLLKSSLRIAYCM